MSAYEAEQIEIIRRILERGLNSSVEYKLSSMADIFQHALDELERLKRSLEK